MFIFLSQDELNQLCNKTPEDTFITIDNSIIGKKELISKISQGINSPYIEDNWDGLEESLIDLSWVSNGIIKIIHRELPILTDLDMIVYVSVLKTVTSSWENIDKSVYIQDLKVYFSDSLKLYVENLLNTEII